MPKTIGERIAETKEKIKQNENQIKQLMQKQKEIERRARTHRLIERGALLESLISDAESLENEDIKAVLIAALNSKPAQDTLALVQNSKGISVAAPPTPEPYSDEDEDDE